MHAYIHVHTCICTVRKKKKSELRLWFNDTFGTRRSDRCRRLLRVGLCWACDRVAETIQGVKVYPASRLAGLLFAESPVFVPLPETIMKYHSQLIVDRPTAAEMIGEQCQPPHDGLISWLGPVFTAEFRYMPQLNHGVPPRSGITPLFGFQRRLHVNFRGKHELAAAKTQGRPKKVGQV